MVLPPPPDTSPVRELVAALAELIGEAETVAVCVDLLRDAPARSHAEALPYLGGPGPADGVLTGRWKAYWARTWGARGLLYVWRPTAEPAVLAGLHDEHWRVVEMCLKVGVRRELAAGGDRAAALTADPTPRVRAAAVRLLGAVGDTEHVSAVVEALDDDEAAVRGQASAALERLAERLDGQWQPGAGSR